MSQLVIKPRSLWQAVRFWWQLGPDYPLANAFKKMPIDLRMEHVKRVTRLGSGTYVVDVLKTHLQYQMYFGDEILPELRAHALPTSAFRIASKRLMRVLPRMIWWKYLLMLAGLCLVAWAVYAGRMLLLSGDFGATCPRDLVGRIWKTQVSLVLLAATPFIGFVFTLWLWRNLVQVTPVVFVRRLVGIEAFLYAALSLGAGLLLVKKYVLPYEERQSLGVYLGTDLTRFCQPSSAMKRMNEKEAR